MYDQAYYGSVDVITGDYLAGTSTPQTLRAQKADVDSDL